MDENLKQIEDSWREYHEGKTLYKKPATERRKYWLELIRRRTPTGGLIVNMHGHLQINDDILWLEKKGKIRRLRKMKFPGDFEKIGKGKAYGNKVRYTCFVVVDMNVKY